MNTKNRIPEDSEVRGWAKKGSIPARNKGLDRKSQEEKNQLRKSDRIFRNVSRSLF